MPAETPERPFLTAAWRYLAMLNYVVEPALLAPLVPAGTELDQFDGATYVSVVGFRFEHIRIRGLWIPFHSNFDEVNLRFYVKRTHAGTERRGVVFVREIVPRWAVAKVARWAFHEKYIALPMRHHVSPQASEGGAVSAQYSWRSGAGWNSVSAECEGRAGYAAEGSLQQFITEHYWGYAAAPDGSSLEYRVEHPPWLVWPAARAQLQGDAEGLFGPQFAQYLAREPASAFIAEGSGIAVYPGTRLLET